MRKLENYKKRAVENCCGLVIILSLLTFFTFGCRAEQPQGESERRNYATPTANPAGVETKSPTPIRERSTSIGKDSEQNANSAETTEASDQTREAKVAKSGDLGYLRQWVGKYTFSGSTKKQKSFFSLPEIKIPLRNLLGKVKFKKLLESFTRSLPVIEQEDYLILEGISDINSEHLTHSLVTVDLKSGKLAVAFVTGNYPADSTFESYGNYDELPEAAKTIITKYK